MLLSKRFKNNINLPCLERWESFQGEKMAKPLLCNSCVIKHTDDSKLEMTLTNCRTSADALTSLMEKYMKENIEKGVGYDVTVGPFTADKTTVFGRSSPLPSQKNGIYFFGDMRKNRVVFTFDKGNQTLNYLLGFYFNQTIKR